MLITFQESEKEGELKQVLAEREEEMRLAIEERELQKMAALSKEDTVKDQLTEQLRDLTQVIRIN